MREFKTWRDPYEAGFSTCRPTKIQIEEGLTVLVGCNGAGKSTLIANIQEELKKENIPYATFNNLHDGGSHGVDWAAYNRNYDILSDMVSSSEGENISINLSIWASGLRKFVYDGLYKNGSRGENLAEIFMDDNRRAELKVKNDALKEHKERWILIDAADSGYSIDNVLKLKDLFNLIKEDASKNNKDLYIVISANEYELANGESCFDVNAGKYVTFKDYEDYKKFILKSRENKDKRIEQARAKKEKKMTEYTGE